MKCEIETTAQFRRDYELAVRRGQNINLLQEIIDDLATGKPLPKNKHDHPLTGNWVGYRECHVAPDWLLVYKIAKNVLVLVLARTGSHSDLF